MSDILDIPGYLVTMDIEKAFDSLDHDFLLSILKKFGFGGNFVYRMKVLLNNQQSCIIMGDLQFHILIKTKVHARVIPYRHTCLYLL